jgi:hypothetical protein
METPTYLQIGFVLITVVTVFLFLKSVAFKRPAILIVLVLLAVQSILSLSGFFLATDSLPPRFLAVLLPSVIAVILAFTTQRGKTVLDAVNPETYTYLFTIRVAVEFVILGLVIHKAMPESMSFEGRNFDILSGLSAPFIAYYGFRKKQIGTKALMAWNVVALLLVIQVVTTGILSIPSPIQQLSFDQPNLAVLYFPYVLLPGIVVPIVIFGHLAILRKLTRSK